MNMICYIIILILEPEDLLLFYPRIQTVFERVITDNSSVDVTLSFQTNRCNKNRNAACHMQCLHEMQRRMSLI